MRLITPPENRRLVWYLALEEYLAQSPSEEILFFWTVPPTVIFGRHQLMQNEVNLPFCREHHIATYRRKSGGGCVYADRGNLMISYISPSTHSEQVFQHFLDLLADALRAAGYPAVTTAHNDILVHDRKVSGNACYALPSATIVHGTLLWSVDFDTLSQALTPPPSKLLKHGVASVRQRVVNLAELPATEPIHSIHDMQRYLSCYLATNDQRLTGASPKNLPIFGVPLTGASPKNLPIFGVPLTTNDQRLTTNDQRLTGASPKNLPIFGVPLTGASPKNLPIFGVPLTTNDQRLTTNDLKEVDRIEQTYLSPSFINDKI